MVDVDKFSAIPTIHVEISLSETSKKMFQKKTFRRCMCGDFRNTSPTAKSIQLRVQCVRDNHSFL